MAGKSDAGELGGWKAGGGWRAGWLECRMAGEPDAGELVVAGKSVAWRAGCGWKVGSDACGTQGRPPSPRQPGEDVGGVQ